MTKYFIEPAIMNNPNNKPSKEIYDFVRKLDRKTVSNFKSFVQWLNDNVSGINNRYPKCNPFRVGSDGYLTASEKNEKTIIIRSNNISSWYCRVRLHNISSEYNVG